MKRFTSEKLHELVGKKSLPPALTYEQIEGVLDDMHHYFRGRKTYVYLDDVKQALKTMMEAKG